MYPANILTPSVRLQHLLAENSLDADTAAFLIAIREHENAIAYALDENSISGESLQTAEVLQRVYNCLHNRLPPNAADLAVVQEVIHHVHAESVRPNLIISEQHRLARVQAAQDAEAEIDTPSAKTVDAIERILAAEVSLIVDMDDTLISNQVLFNQSRRELLALCRTLNSSLAEEEIDDMLTVIDRGLLPQYGFTPRRWYETARALTRAVLGRPVGEALPHDLDEAALAAADVALGLGEVLPGVHTTLHALTAAGVPMVLKTKGDLAKQSEKLDGHRFDRYFGERIVIIDRKTTDTFVRCAKYFALSNTYSIGDSAPSDIIPALEAGLGAVYINRGNLKAAAPETHDSEVSVAHVADFPTAIIQLGSDLK